MANDPADACGLTPALSTCEPWYVPASVAIIGLGLIGCSLALALRAACASVHIVGHDASPSAAEVARQRGAVDSTTRTPALAVRSADLVVLAVPPSAMVDAGLACGSMVAAGAVVTDVAGTKRRIVSELGSIFGAAYVGSHPMAGSECSGPEHASANLFEGAPWIVTPTPASDPLRVDLICGLAGLVGASPFQMTAAEHDRVVALLSHLPHALAYSLVATCRAEIPEDCDSLAGGSYRDICRVAGSSPGLWRDILEDNSDEVLRGLRALGARLAAIEQALAAGHGDRLLGLLQAGAWTPGDSR